MVGCDSSLARIDVAGANRAVLARKKVHDFQTIFVRERLGYQGGLLNFFRGQPWYA